jgi:hypothetical protein
VLQPDVPGVHPMMIMVADRRFSIGFGFQDGFSLAHTT